MTKPLATRSAGVFSLTFRPSCFLRLRMLHSHRPLTCAAFFFAFFFVFFPQNLEQKRDCLLIKIWLTHSHTCAVSCITCQPCLYKIRYDTSIYSILLTKSIQLIGVIQSNRLLLLDTLLLNSICHTFTFTFIM